MPSTRTRPPTTGRRPTHAASGDRSRWPRSGRETCSTPASPSTRCIRAGPYTPGLRAALPGFSRVVGPPLRTPEEGADTIVWLAAAPDAADLSGLFFLDRRPRAKHRLRRTRRLDDTREAARLRRLCTERHGRWTGWYRRIRRLTPAPVVNPGSGCQASRTSRISPEPIRVEARNSIVGTPESAREPTSWRLER